ncbi:membrane alanyl aminopeptidase-like [Bombyx mori]|uniref:Aminopeptidase N-11 n=1 Tax=Bombyx mori TaxID=7091 RepID=I3VR82_BOMMO|nr:membrane alanyl aminopeptidase-like [Bombyx mori]AFK85027.1 aminopeptidase N-11 [Bombyx mori]
MARRKYKWKFTFFYFLILLNIFTNCLPIDKKLRQTTNDATFSDSNPDANSAESHLSQPDTFDEKTKFIPEDDSKRTAIVSTNAERNQAGETVRPGQTISSYEVEITIEENRFKGRAVIELELDANTRDDPIKLYSEDLDVTSVRTGVFTEANSLAATFRLRDGFLEITPVQSTTSYVVVVEYTGILRNDGNGIYRVEGNGVSYLAMNLHPTHARRVFPCFDEPNEAANIRFTFNDVEFNNIVTNSLPEENAENRFRALASSPHRWGMIAHDFINLNIPTTDVLLVGRPGLSNQDSQASLAINAFFSFLNEWTEKPYFEIILNQESRMHVIALPDVDRDWHALSIVGIWEPYLLMETTASVKQRKTALVKIAETMAKQWFGYVMYPENWRFEWVVTGLATYAAYEAVISFQTSTVANDVTLLDMNTIFVTDIIHESMLHDAYVNANPLEPKEELYDEDEIRSNIYGLSKLKAPAILHMLKLVLGDEGQDFVHSAAKNLLRRRSVETVNTHNLIGAIIDDWSINGNEMIDDIESFLEPWIENNGYPMIHVGLRQDGSVFIMQERFSFTPQAHVNYEIPITYTTKASPNFNNIRPILMMDATTNLNVRLTGDEWVLFNIQGQSYYRVNYDDDIWDRILEALEDPEDRKVIHPLNRAKLVDDALNLARSGKLDYEIAFKVVLSMEHETEYAVWKAFVRNMDFLRKRLIAHVTEDDDLDPDIYMRMVRRTVGALEDEIGFNPDTSLTEPAMVSLTRGLVMDHACRANYEPCIAAAIDLFYNPNNNEEVNPNIPSDIRPAVYCTMVREGDEDVIEALKARLEVEANHYERVVILESLACSDDQNFIRNYLEETIAAGNEYGVEERVRIFRAVAESSYENARVALSFISMRTNEIRDNYGGPKKLEEILFVLGENMANDILSEDFRIWVRSQSNDLDDSQGAANRALAIVLENVNWIERHQDYVYDWIDENDAPTLAASLILICITIFVTLFNN